MQKIKDAITSYVKNRKPTNPIIDVIALGIISVMAVSSGENMTMDAIVAVTLIFVFVVIRIIVFFFKGKKQKGDSC